MNKNKKNKQKSDRTRRYLKRHSMLPRVTKVDMGSKNKM